MADGDPTPSAELMTVLAKHGLTGEPQAAGLRRQRQGPRQGARPTSSPARHSGSRQTPTLFINEQNYFNPGGLDAIAAILRQVGR